MAPIVTFVRRKNDIIMEQKNYSKFLDPKYMLNNVKTYNDVDELTVSSSDSGRDEMAPYIVMKTAFETSSLQIGKQGRKPLLCPSKSSKDKVNWPLELEWEENDPPTNKQHVSYCSIQNPRDE